MNKKLEAITPGASLNGLKWILVIVLIVAGVWANYYYSQIDWPIRLAGWIVLACITLGISSQTVAGHKAWEFSKGARGELRKVVWPTRQETVQTTMVVVGMVVLMALILWGIDSILLWLVGWLTGQRG